MGLNDAVCEVEGVSDCEELGDVEGVLLPDGDSEGVSRELIV